MRETVFELYQSIVLTVLKEMTYVPAPGLGDCPSIFDFVLSPSAQEEARNWNGCAP